MLSLGLVLLLGIRIQAGEVSGDAPDHYAPLLKNRPKRLQKDKLTAKDLEAYSAQVHNVSVITEPDASADILPASNRPKGALQLDKVMIVDPSSR
jgi:hypothetical protein